ncbi:Crp/Fnr family transcriptional regulator [Sphingomonas aracearum]|uniref:Crp/Fnr family transcriptional regulator n=1 Tax=Sphingomonas aracearum TaxID=2283317 RepID=A0A369VYM8_9SPHN|nr:Crp/Fnr family transcriptional regulator [Sphingomonas aracearum]RDE07506.1 Crp/Fnr family transcriptional regulator [Sphingomonas aracearum]
MSIALFLRTHPLPALEQADRDALEAAMGPAQEVAPRQIIVRENVPLHSCTLLLSGFVQRYKDAANGNRQSLGIHIPGDFVDLHSYPLGRLEHSIATITPVRIASVRHEQVRALTARTTVLTQLLWRATLVDAAINREWLLGIGVRPAAQRVAHLLCEMYVRLERIGMTRGLRFDLPLTQTDIAEATGLTPVHTNRMLRQLREEGLAEFRQGMVQIPDWPALKRFAEFDTAYLFLD